MNKHMFTLGITDSPLRITCISYEETPLYVVTETEDVINVRAQFLGDRKSLRTPEIS